MSCDVTVLQVVIYFLLLALFADLDIHSHLGVISYGVSMTTLEDVFLKLEAEAEIDQAGKNQLLPPSCYNHIFNIVFELEW